MKNQNSSTSQKSLSFASKTLRDPKASRQLKSLAAQDLSEHRWLTVKERELSSRGKLTARMTTSRRLTSR
jgi:hypothetical protein